MPIPRFANPHLLPESSRQASRSEIFVDNDSASDGAPEFRNEDLVSQLHDLIQRSLDIENPSHRPKKRRKVETHQEDLKSVEFRLLSTSIPPLHISLEPKPPPPPITREPECEDNEAQANLRHQRAMSAAIEASQIIDLSRKQLPAKSKEMSYSTVVPMVQTPPLLVLERKQQPRRTRPPVPAHQLNHFPYNAKGTPHPVSGPAPACPIVEVTPAASDQKSRRLRRRGKSLVMQRPPPAFWGPDPSWKGKCLGYAYGYSNPY